MEHRYRKIMRNIKAYLLTEQKKKSFLGKMLNYIGRGRLYDERYWKWHRAEVAIGAGWGAAAAVSALPLQTFWAILAAWWRKGNIPAAAVMAWLSPPFFMFFFTPVQWFVGHYMLGFFPIDGSNLTYGTVKEFSKMLYQEPMSSWTIESLENVNWLMGGVEYVLGHTLTCSIAGIGVYFLVHGIWLLMDFINE